MSNELGFCEAELVVSRIREILRDPDLYDSYNSVTTRCLVRDIKEAMGVPLNGTDVPPVMSAHEPAIDADHLERQRSFSTATFGPGARTDGVLDHIGSRNRSSTRSRPSRNATSNGCGPTGALPILAKLSSMSALS